LSHGGEAFPADNRIGLAPHAVIKKFGREDVWNRAHRRVRASSFNAVIFNNKGVLMAGDKDFMDVGFAHIPPSGFLCDGLNEILQTHETVLIRD
jgi:hypothetical protein